MKKRILTLTVALATILNSNAQSSKKDWALGLHFGTQEYNGDYGNEEFFSFSQHAAYGISLTKYITPTWDVMGMATFSTLDNGDSTGSFKTDFLDFNVMAKLKFNNGKILKEDALIAPYLFLGLGDGVSYIHPSRSNGERFPFQREISFNFLGGLGFNINVSDRWAINLMSKYTYMWTDKIDANTTGYNWNDQALTHTAGLVYKFTCKKDSDEDGVYDKDDKCPNVFGLAKFNGCPDTDLDGVQDSEDACPNDAGTLNGCPDTDKDGIADKDDTCPTITGIAAFNGCPDTDGDGVQDSEDKCPKVAGTLGGCPDTDKDGVADKDDACPNVFGTIKGCPDTDKDGVIDSEDKCPKVAGTIANGGCPEIKEEAKKAFDQAMEGLFFNSGSAVIKPASYTVLNNVAKILAENPTYNLKIEGHTDNTGNEAKNLQLSKDRAASAKAYLVSKGIDASRMTTDGFGITKPRADNATPAGRTLNRRVEFTPVF